MKGNNIKCVGVNRLNVLLYDPQNITAGNSTGRFYLPDHTFLQSKYIVGVQCLVYAPAIYTELPQNSPSESVLGITCLYAQPSVLQNFYLTLYNKNGGIAIENFPLLQLNNNNYFGVTVPDNKIIPIEGYFNFRESFVFTPNQAVGSNNQTTLAFYYK